MVPIKIILIIALTMALSITLTMRTIDQVVGEEPRIDIDDAADDESSSFSTALSSSQGEQAASTYSTAEKSLIPSRRLSRFLAEKDNATGTDKDQDAVNRNRSKTCKKMCKHVKGKRMHCCDNKCVDKKTDSNNCGKCGKKCLLTETCCGGHCVYLFMDKRHCGKCYHKCPGEDAVCTLGLCNYA